ncbi:MAG TPA: pantoate--beta-alanine ligase [Friedmanniella sp.]
MKVARSIAELRGLRDEVPAGHRVGFVATMGALHAGHASLIEQAQALSDTVVVSIFVNPLQFGPGEDYARYPRPIETDLDRCAELGVDIVFVPAVSDLYPPGRQVSVSAGTMGTVLEGAVRPGHFDGVLTVVLKLLNLVRPQVAVFGRKDAQQLACVWRMVADLNLDVRIVGGSTVREPDGLALSSRNVFLSPADRGLALSLVSALEKAAAQSTFPAALDAAWEVLDKASLDPEFVLDYLAAVNPETFAEVGADHGGDVLLVVAAKVGAVRLIDNLTLHRPEPVAPLTVPRLPSPR